MRLTSVRAFPGAKDVTRKSNSRIWRSYLGHPQEPYLPLNEESVKDPEPWEWKKSSAPISFQWFRGTSQSIYGKGQYMIPKEIAPEQVVIVRGVNRHLVPHDFQRTLAINQRPYLRVIPMRNFSTLERENNYMVVFQDVDSAAAWRSHLNYLANMTHRHTMTSTLVPHMVPQEGFTINGEHVAGIVRRFTLIPAGSPMSTQFLYNPTTARKKVIERGGYTAIVDKAGKLLPRVMVKVKGFPVHKKDIMQGLLYDSLRRNMAWPVAWPKGNQYPTILEINDEAWKSQNKLGSPSTKRLGDEQRWVITFRDNRGARTFARVWHAHKFPFPPLNEPRWELSNKTRKRLEDGQEAMTYTEVLW